MKIIIKENDVKKAIREYLELKGYKVYRINNGGSYRGKNKKGGARYSFAGSPGVPDLYAMKDGSSPLWIETKSTGERATASQLEFGELANKTVGTLWVCADSLDKFINWYDTNQLKI